MADEKKTASQDQKNQSPKLSPTEADKRREEEEKPHVARYFTEDGTPVEPTNIPPKNRTEPDLDARPDVHERFIPADKHDVRNESELDEKK